MSELTALRLFVAVAERRSFAEAARGLRLSSSAASRLIAGLEARLGVALLHRTTRSVSLTGEGAAFLDRSRSAIEAFDDAMRSARNAAVPRGTLVVTAPVVFGRLHILPIVTALIGDHAELNVELMLTDRVTRLAEEGVDVAVRIAPLPDSALHAVAVAGVRRVLVASPVYLANGRPAIPADLESHTLIGFDGLGASTEWRFAGNDRIRIAPRLLTNSAEASIDAALAGVGIARALSYQVDAHVRAGRLAYVLPAHDPPPVPVSLVYPANRQGAPHARAFIDAARRYFRAYAIEG